RWLDLFFRYDNVQIDDPWTIPGNSQSVPNIPSREIAYTFQNRGKGGFRVRPRDWLQLSYDFTADSFENSNFRGRAQRFANTVSVSLTPIAGLTAFAGYTQRVLNTSNLILIAPRYQPTFPVQDGNEDVITTPLNYDFRLAGYSWSTGWNLAWFQSNNRLMPSFESGLPPQKRYDLSRFDAGAFLAFHHPFIEPAIEIRRITYRQDPLSRNDYKATIAVFRLTRRFDFFCPAPRLGRRPGPHPLGGGTSPRREAGQDTVGRRIDPLRLPVERHGRHEAGLSDADPDHALGVRVDHGDVQPAHVVAVAVDRRRIRPRH